MGAILAEITAASAFLKEKLPRVPEVVMVLGSGWGDFADQLTETVIIPYGEIPHFAVSTAPGHVGRLVWGRFAGKDLLVMQGRFHYYEGYELTEVTFPIQVFHALGIAKFIVTNAAGGLNPQYHPGDLMLISDHINFLGSNPLRGPNEQRLGPRFPDLTDAYNANWRGQVQKIAAELGIPLQEGVYVGDCGPSFETPAEVRMFRQWGGDAVGMSTVAEVIVANFLGMDVLGISCITNMAAGITGKKISSADVNETAAQAGESVKRLLAGIIGGL